MKQGNSYVFMKITVIVSMLVGEVLTSSSTKNHIYGSYLELKKKAMHALVLGDKRKPISQNKINQCAYNDHLYETPRMYPEYSPILNRFSGLTYAQISKPQTENTVLIKNLKESTHKNPAFIRMKPVQVRRSEFSYRFPIVNLLVPSTKKAVTILITHHAIGKKITDLHREASSHLKKLDMADKDIFTSVIFVESVVYVLLESLLEKDSELVKINDLIHCRFHSSSACCREDIEHTAENKPFRIEYLLYAKDALDQFNQLVASTPKKIKKHNKREKRKEKTEEIYYISKEKEEGIEVGTWAIISFLRNRIINYNVLCNRNSSMNGSHFKYLKYILKDMLEIRSNNHRRKEKISKTIEDEIACIADREVCRYTDILSTVIYNSDKSVPETVEPFINRLFSSIVKVLDEHEKKGEIIYIKGFFDDIITKAMEVMFYLEVQKQINCTSKSFDTCLAYAKDILDKIEFNSSLVNLKKMFNGVFSDLADNIETVISIKENKKVEINKDALSIAIFYSIYTDFSHYLRGLLFTTTRTKNNNQLWTNPAFMHCNRSSPQEATLYVIYKNGKDEKLYKKEVRNTIKNLKKFSKAETHKDIESMEGEESKEISMDELFELEKSEIQATSFSI